MHKFFKKYGLLLYSFLLSAVVLGICSKSSPLYPMNDWVDVHCFFTIGRELLDGKVLYVDLYEQKGPILYFIYALISLISSESFWGIFLLEVATFTLFLYYSGKIIGLYSKYDLWNCIAITVLAVVIGTCPALAHGGSVEQMCLGFMAYGLYCLLSAFRDDRVLSFKEGLINGLFAGMILWIKFTMLGFYAGLCLTVVLYYCFVRRKFMALLQLMGAFLLGVGAVSAVVAIYFLVNGALDALWTAYFYNNLFLYPNESETSKLSQILFCLKWALKYNPGFTWLLYLGLAWLAALCWKRPMELVCAALCFAGLAALTYWGGKGIMQGYGYYDLVLSLFAVFGLCGIGWLLSCIPIPIDKYKTVSGYLLAPILVACLLVSGSFCIKNGRNVYLMDYEKEDMPQYRFAETIRKVDSPTLLNYGFLDGGFYYASGAKTNCRFFCTFNVAAPDMWDTMWECLWAGDVDFVVTRSYTLPGTFSKYELVDMAQMMFEGIDFTYYLYQLKE